MKFVWNGVEFVCSVDEFRELFPDGLKAVESSGVVGIPSREADVVASNLNEHFGRRKRSKWSRDDVRLLKDNKDKHISDLLKLFPDKTNMSIYRVMRKHHINRGRILSNKKGYVTNRRMMNFMNARAKVLRESGLSRNDALSMAGREWKSNKHSTMIDVPKIVEHVKVSMVDVPKGVSRHEFLSSRVKYLQDVMRYSREFAMSIASKEWGNRPINAFPDFSSLSPVFSDNHDGFIVWVRNVVNNRVRIGLSELSAWLGVVIDEAFFERFITHFLLNSDIISKYFGVPNKFVVVDDGEKLLLYDG